MSRLVGIGGDPVCAARLRQTMDKRAATTAALNPGERALLAAGELAIAAIDRDAGLEDLLELVRAVWSCTIMQIEFAPATHPASPAARRLNAHHIKALRLLWEKQIDAAGSEEPLGLVPVHVLRLSIESLRQLVDLGLVLRFKTKCCLSPMGARRIAEHDEAHRRLRNKRPGRRRPGKPPSMRGEA